MKEVKRIVIYPEATLVFEEDESGKGLITELRPEKMDVIDEDGKMYSIAELVNAIKGRR